MATHYLPKFVESRWPRAVCGQSARFQVIDHSTEPTCPRCAAWLEADHEQAAALEALWKLDEHTHAAKRTA